MDHQGGEVRVVSAAVLAQLQAAGFQVQFSFTNQLNSLTFFFKYSLTLIIKFMIYTFFVHKKKQLNHLLHHHQKINVDEGIYHTFMIFFNFN